ncbi:carbohydrate ABC transporter permease [Bradyrhizobium sp. CB3481]|uniref:carbohydrate ABC transporter permease n=1 Tax=Bradyrhizobium sp. CB3481 TaxID=3039158 RepID=UPI0024B17F8E|nr:carbohydrate ABC transporter permease [Bradyrhizobium sp. CB3481]WFU14677.1 carbohydrate ABC transporter permease [Bradyrhizobium sp. CB3481]
MIALALGSLRRAIFAISVAAIFVLFVGPIVILGVTSLRPASGVFYIWRGTNFTLNNFVEVLHQSQMLEAVWNSFVLSTLATILSLGITELSRFGGWIQRSWFATIYLFRTVPYISWVLPLYLVNTRLGIYDTYLGLLLPHIAVHVCFFSWLMKGFFDGINPSMEYAALIDGCTRWGAFCRVALPAAMPGIAALAILCWLSTWNEFLFVLILSGKRTPLITSTMAQFVTETGTEWNLMSATAVLAMMPALLVTSFGQKYVIRGLQM